VKGSRLNDRKQNNVQQPQPSKHPALVLFQTHFNDLQFNDFIPSDCGGAAREVVLYTAVSGVLLTNNGSGAISIITYLHINCRLRQCSVIQHFTISQGHLYIL
jgi:hypothetical protein